MTEESRKRSREEIIYTILRQAINGAKKTHIMYRANFSHAQLSKYLKVLTALDFLNETHDGYITTQKGKRYIRKFLDIEEILNTAVNIEPYNYLIE